MIKHSNKEKIRMGNKPVTLPKSCLSLSFLIVEYVDATTWHTTAKKKRDKFYRREALTFAKRVKDFNSHFIIGQFYSHISCMGTTNGSVKM